ncbi:MAG: HAMP domain-containing sensor histidine kinase [Phycisphaerales bacterium]
MKHHHPSWWRWFWGGVIVAAGAMTGVSTLVLRMEQTGFVARADAGRQGLLRLALWRMDSWLTPQLGREAARPYYEYLPYYANPDTYTQYYSRIPQGEVVSPSSLLTFESPIFPIHFQVELDGSVTSPQVPTGNALDLAQYNFQLSNAVIEDNRSKLDEVTVLLATTDLAEACGVGETQLLSVTETPPTEESLDKQVFSQSADQSVLNRSERWKRIETTRAVQQQPEAQPLYVPPQQKLASANREQIDGQLEDLDVNAEDGTSRQRPVQVGPLVAAWIKSQEATDGDSDEAHRLFYVRRVTIGEDELFQGVLVDWPTLRESLLEQASDLLPELDLIPQYDPVTDNDQSVWTLATIPAVLASESTLAMATPVVTPARLTLVITWMALAGACVAVGLTLRSSIDYGQRRKRFASAVTHELRTPLTTFRMYSEMLDDGMVRDEDQQKLYFRTLREESTRLTALVENMLAYARVEEGRHNRSPESISIVDLADRLESAVDHRAEQSGVCVKFNDVDESSRFHLDVESIEQVVCNLVDNAMKYGCADESKAIQVDIETKDRHLFIRVRDFGPGVEPTFSKLIFEPFDRGAVPPGTNVPGVGIGLSLSRGLAIGMGGSLELESVRDGNGGACFVLRVPLDGQEPVT